jgi:hypothetical protein
MKKLKTITLCSILLLSAVSVTVLANDKYTEAMQKSITEVYQASDITQLQKAVNALERIASAENQKWEPQYYVAFGYLMMATREQDAAKKDTYLDQAMAAIEKAKMLAPKESEIIAAEGFVYMMRVTVDPGSRGADFAPLAMQTFGKARALNPENPRALALAARMQYGSAQFFGSSTAEACGLVEKALEKFETYQSANPLAPVWGKPMAESLRQTCK